MAISKEDKKRILKFITYYRGLKTNDKGEIRAKIIQECDFSENTFYYKLEHVNYSRPQINIIETIYINYKNGTKES